jgi:hypothetical protein
MNEQRTKALIGVMGIALAAMILFGSSASAVQTCCGEKVDSKVLLRQTMHKLWAEHAIWTREYIVASIAGSPDAEEASNRLLKNQEDIGNAIAPFYGVEAGKKITELLKAHILIAVDVVGAAKSGDQAKLKEADQEWHDNADAIASFLSGANAYWRQKDLTDLLYRHLSLTTDEVVARLQKNWREDIVAFDKNLDHMMMMAEGLADGIIKQFPARF